MHHEHDPSIPSSNRERDEAESKRSREEVELIRTNNIIRGYIERIQDYIQYSGSFPNEDEIKVHLAAISDLVPPLEAKKEE
jgi:hypothetical protein